MPPLLTFSPASVARYVAVESATNPRFALGVLVGVALMPILGGMVVASVVFGFIALSAGPVSGGAAPESSDRPAALSVVDFDSGSYPTGPVSKDQTVVVEGIRVHTSIAENLEGLLALAADSGVDLAGWGWRDNAKQIELRRLHCGTTEYAIYEMPSRLCSPPTARPGRSRHERGTAVDFTYNGTSITSRKSRGYVFLDENAPRFGLCNLPSEPWHWSVDCH